MNIVILKGRLVADPVVKVLDLREGKVPVCTFTVATSRQYTKKSNGEKVKEVQYIDCEAWSSGASLIGQYMCKGKEVLLNGLLKQDKWQDKDGNKRSRLFVRVENFEFCGKPSDNSSNNNEDQVEPEKDSDTESF